MSKNSAISEVFYFLLGTVIFAFIGVMFWFLIVIMARWVLLFALIFFGVDWAPAFFGWGTVLFAGLGAAFGLLSAYAK